MQRFASPLPLKAVGFAQSLWIKSNLAGLLALSGLTDSAVTLDACLIADAIAGDRLYRVTLAREGWVAGGSSVNSAVDALEKAFGELCEIVSLFQTTQPLGRTRNGVATASNEHVARGCAYRELIERDSLITHFLCPEVRSFPLSPPSYVLLPAKFAELWSADPNIRVVLAGIQDAPHESCYLGAGADPSLEIAVRKAYLESVSVYCGYRNADHRLSERDRQVRQHILASKSPAVKASIHAIFAGKGTVIPGFNTSALDASFEKLACFGNRWVVVSARHACLCALSLGELWNDSRDLIVSLLAARKLMPSWAIHPFA